jgi:hypothetical protein
MNARIALCGAISQYGTDDKAPGPHDFCNLLWKRARAEGFIVSDYAADKEAWAKAYQDISQWHLDGKLSYRVHTIDGLANAARAVTKLFNGTNNGKLLVRVSDEPQWSGRATTNTARPHRWSVRRRRNVKLAVLQSLSRRGEG